MKSTFNIGTHNFHEEPNMNYQLNRVYSVFGNVVVMHLGFDAVKEELIPIINFFRVAGLDIKSPMERLALSETVLQQEVAN